MWHSPRPYFACSHPSSCYPQFSTVQPHKFCSFNQKLKNCNGVLIDHHTPNDRISNATDHKTSERNTHIKAMPEKCESFLGSEFHYVNKIKRFNNSYQNRNTLNPRDFPDFLNTIGFSWHHRQRKRPLAPHATIDHRFQIHPSSPE